MGVFGWVKKLERFFNSEENEVVEESVKVEVAESVKKASKVCSWVRSLAQDSNSDAAKEFVLPLTTDSGTESDSRKFFFFLLLFIV